jgi:hypothetical protein
MVRVASQVVSLSLRDSAGAMELIPLALRWFLVGVVVGFLCALDSLQVVVPFLPLMCS